MTFPITSFIERRQEAVKISDFERGESFRSTFSVSGVGTKVIELLESNGLKAFLTGDRVYGMPSRHLSRLRR